VNVDQPITKEFEMKFLTVDNSAEIIGAPYKGRMLINGELCDAQNGNQAERRSPAHDVVVGIYPDAARADAECAIDAARAAFDEGTWPNMPARERADVLLKVADGISARVEEMALIECLETGKPLTQARGEVSGCVDLWKYAASLARSLHGESYNTLGESHLGVVLRQPVGVVSMITPWNFPIWILSQKLPFALAAGCTAVIKPSELTNGTTLMLGEILLEAGLPKGVVNIVTGLGPAVGQPLVGHPKVDMVSFTGSTRVGRLIAAETLKSSSRIVTGTQLWMPLCSASISTRVNAATAAAVSWCTKISLSVSLRPLSNVLAMYLWAIHCMQM